MSGFARNGAGFGRRLLRGAIPFGWVAALGVFGLLHAPLDARGSGVEVIVIGEPGSLALSDRSVLETAAAAEAFLRTSDASGALVYRSDGTLYRVYVVGSDGSLVYRGQAVEPEGSGEPNEERELAEALRIAADPEASFAERQAAIARLARSGRREAVTVLEEVLTEDQPALRRTAFAALGGFAGSEAAAAAQAVLDDHAAGDEMSVDQVRAQAAFDPSPLLRALREAPNPLVKKNLVYSAAHAAQGPALTEFFLEALRDQSSTVRSVAALELVRMGDRVEALPVLQALLDASRSDPSGSVRRAAREALSLRQAGGGVPTLEPAPELTPEDVRRLQGGNESSDGRRTDDEPVTPRRRDSTPLTPGEAS